MLSALMGRSSDKHQTPPLQTLAFQTSATDKNTTILSRVEPNGATFPLFTYTKAKRTFQLTRVGAGPTAVQPTPVGVAKIHAFSHTELNFMDADIEVKPHNGMKGHEIDHPRFGQVKWQERHSRKEGFLIEDANDTKLGRFVTGPNKAVIGGFLEIFVPVDDLLLDLIVLFTVAMTMKSQSIRESAETANAVAGVVGAFGGGGA